MSFNVYPSVSFDEIDLTTAVIQSATTTGAFAGVFAWGPVGEVTATASEVDLAAKFGKPSGNNYESWFTVANFLSYGNNALVVRAANTTDTGTNSYLSAIANAGANAQAIPYYTIKTLTDYENKLSGNSGYFAGQGAEYIARWPGALGNSLKVSICDSAEAYSSNVNLWNVAHSNTSANAVCAATANSLLAFTVGSNQATVTLANATGFTDGNTTALATLLSTIILSNGDVIVAGNTLIGTQQMTITGISSVLTQNSVGVNTGVASFTLNFSNQYRLSSNITQNTFTRSWGYASQFSGAPGQTLYQAQFGNTAANDAMDVVVVDALGKISGVPGTILEKFQNLSRATDAKTAQGDTNFVQTVLQQNSSWLWYAADRSGANTTNSSSVTSSTNIKPYYQAFVAGQDGLSEGSVSFGDIALGYDQFLTANVAISLVMTGKNDSAGELANYVTSNLVTVRRDCVAFISPYKEAVVNNKGNEAANASSFAASLSGSTYWVMSSGYKYQYDKYNDVYRWIPLNGDDAGLCAQTDANRDPWFSPAGLNRGQYKNCIKLSWNPNPQEQATLYNNKINPSVTITGKGSFLMGDKTGAVDPTSAFSRINVRRLFIVLEQSIAAFAQADLFEFNDEFTRAQFVSIVTQYLKGVKGRRGITDFLVVCDDTNNTPAIVDANQFVGDIYIKPARSINFINLNFVAVATGVDFTEVVGQF